MHAIRGRYGFTPQFPTVPGIESVGVIDVEMQRRSTFVGSQTGRRVHTMPGKRGRSAITGRFVKQSTVKKNPNTTTNESTGKGRKKK
jgi:hypothetical protein